VDELDEMVLACTEEKGKRVREMMRGLLQRMRESEQQAREITVHFCP
jgi:uncharacterized coiled-coil protein SlyX